MNKIYYILVLLFLAGCEKVIDVDLNEASPEIVIEGNLNARSGELEVKISKTGSYFGNDELQKVNDATVFFEHYSGAVFPVDETADGVYKKNNLQVRPENECRLLVEVDGVEYTARAFLNTEIPIDSLSYQLYDRIAFFDRGYRLMLYFSDPPEVENFYRVKVYKNDTLQNDVSDLVVFDDTGLNGKYVEVTLRGQRFDDGDTARVEFLTLDKTVYEYFSSLRELANTNPGSPAPANPISNFSNGALGYFSAWSYDSKDIVIEKR